MKKLTQKESITALREEYIVKTDSYTSLKKTFQKLGAKANLIEIKKEKKQKEMIMNGWRTFSFDEDEIKPIHLFLANMYVYDDADFANRVEEALSLGVRKEDVVSYLNLQDYSITDTIYHLKLAEFAVYKKYYEKTHIWYMIGNILEKTGAKKVSVEELNEFKQEELLRKQGMNRKQVEKINQKTMEFPVSYSKDKAA